MTTGIQWTDETWTVAVGCDKVSPGCTSCYAAALAHRGLHPTHRGLTVKRRGEPTDWNGTVRLLPERLDEPLRWRKPRRVFVGSMTDLFHLSVPQHYRHDVWRTMAATPRHTYQVLTKRSREMLRACRNFDGDVEPLPALPNVWLGTSIENDRYLFRARHLAQTPAAVRFLSVEPLIGPIDLTDHLDGIGWVIVGCESGPGRRRCHLSWVRDIRDQCAAAGVPLFIKQLTIDDGGIAWDDRVLHNIDDFPADLRIREWPT